MSRCDLEIELESDHYQGGDEIAGSVVVRTKEGFECNVLTVALSTLVHGRGNRKHSTVESLELLSGRVASGVTPLPFRFTLSNGPNSYHGTNLNVDWQIDARVDVAWALDPKASRDFVLESRSEDPYPVVVSKRRTDRSAELGRRIGLAVSTVAFGLAVYLVSLGGVTEDWGPGIAGAVVGLISGGAASALIPPVLASRRLGPVRVEFDPSEARPGDEVTVRISFEPRSVARFLGLKVRLRGFEQVVSGAGTRATTHTHELAEVEGSARLIPRTIRAGEPFEGRATVRIPTQAPPTFHTIDNHLIWTVDCTIELDGWPDWQDSHELMVRPS